MLFLDLCSVMKEGGELALHALDRLDMPATELVDHFEHARSWLNALAGGAPKLWPGPLDLVATSGKRHIAVAG